MQIFLLDHQRVRQTGITLSVTQYHSISKQVLLFQQLSISKRNFFSDLTLTQLYAQQKKTEELNKATAMHDDGSTLTKRAVSCHHQVV